MHNETLLRLAKRSATDVTFMAHMIEQQAKREQLNWEDMANLLNITQAQLARLALCQQPRDAYFMQDIGQIANYAGINRVVLMHLVDCVHKGVRLTRRSQPAPLHQPLAPQLAAGGKSRKSRYFGMYRRAWAIGLAALLMVVMGAFVLAQPAAAEATLVVSAGEAVVNQAGGAIFSGTAETAVASGDVLTVSQGDTIRLAQNGSAQLRLRDGTTVDLAGGSTVAVTELVTDDDSFRVQLNLLTGKTLSRVVRLLRADDTFEIKTPSSTASVRGTVFTVEVQSQSSSLVVVEEGKVHVALTNEQSVDVPAGFQVTAVVGEALQLRPINEPTAAPTDAPEDPEEPVETPTDTPTNTPIFSEDGPEPEEMSPNGPPDQVPGNTPDQVPGEGNPPAGGGTPPGQINNPGNTGETQANKEFICHYIAGEKSNGITLEIEADSVADHLAHGDDLGICQEPTATSDDAGDDDSDESPGNSGNAPGNSGNANNGGNKGSGKP